VTSNTQSLGDEDGEKLLKLCREGKLYEVDRWIADGRSIRIFGKRKKTALDIAIEQGFHSLVELLARNEPDQDIKNKALNQAVEKKRLDLVQLLVSTGAEIRSVPLIDVLLTWEPNLIRFFLEQGADTVANAPFAVAFAERIRTALRPFVDYRQAHPELSEKMQAQVDQALRYVSKKGILNGSA
jgi:hypothetical protein